MPSKIRGKKVVYIGDGRNNVANSLMLGCAKAGVNFFNCTPCELLPLRNMVEESIHLAARNGSTVEVGSDPAAAVEGANVIYTDV